MLTYRELYHDLISHNFDSLSDEILKYGSIVSSVKRCVLDGNKRHNVCTICACHCGHEWKIQKCDSIVVSVSLLH